MISQYIYIYIYIIVLSQYIIATSSPSPEAGSEQACTLLQTKHNIINYQSSAPTKRDTAKQTPKSHV